MFKQCFILPILKVLLSIFCKLPFPDTASDVPTEMDGSKKIRVDIDIMLYRRCKELVLTLCCRRCKELVMIGDFGSCRTSRL